MERVEAFFANVLVTLCLCGEGGEVIRRINLSAVIIVLICFFLPWVQLSCAGAKDSLSGLNLARQDDPLLWLVPLVMGAVLVYGLARYRRANTQVFGLLSAVCGAVVVILLNRERGRVENEVGLVAAQLTGWFWLAFISAIVIVTTAVTMLVRRSRTTEN